MSFKATDNPITWDCDPAFYHAINDREKLKPGDPQFVMSRSELMTFAHNPLIWKRGAPKDDTKALRWGSLIDCIVLAPHRFETDYEPTPETYPATPKKKGDPVEDKPWNWNATYCDDWRTKVKATGKEVVNAKDASNAHKAAAEFRKDPLIVDFLDWCDTCVQVRVEWHDEPTGLVIPFRALIDLVPDEDSERYRYWLGDLKTAANASPNAWRKSVFSEGYHVQAAVYLDAWNAATGEERHTFVHPILETKTNATARRILSLEHIELGRREYVSALHNYCRCLKENIWPGYDDPFIETDFVENGWRIVNPELWMVN